MAENAGMLIVGIIAMLAGAFILYWFGVDGWRALTSASVDGARIFKDSIIIVIGLVFMGVGIKEIHG